MLYINIVHGSICSDVAYGWWMNALPTEHCVFIHHNITKAIRIITWFLIGAISVMEATVIHRLLAIVRRITVENHSLRVNWVHLWYLCRVSDISFNQCSIFMTSILSNTCCQSRLHCLHLMCNMYCYLVRGGHQWCIWKELIITLRSTDFQWLKIGI